MKDMGLFYFQKNLCAMRKYSSMCSLTPHYCTKKPRTQPSKYESSIASFAIKQRQEHVTMESFLLTPVKRMSQSTKQQGQCSYSPKRNQQFSVLIPIYI